MLKIEQDFRNVLPIASAKGFDPNLLLVQAHLESGHFRSDKCSYHNYFGIKPWRNWKGKVAGNQPTNEVIDGKLTPILDGFIMLPDVTAGVNIMCVLIQKYHPLSWQNRNNRNYFTFIASWSTSPEYTKTLNKIYDEMLFGEYGGLEKC